ncbi:hypothetical protein ACTFIV_001985 [Dictyostelium citrinum]
MTVVNSYSIDFSKINKNKYNSNNLNSKGWGNPFDFDGVEEDQLLELNNNFIRFSNMHEKLLMGDGKFRKPSIKLQKSPTINQNQPEKRSMSTKDPKQEQIKEKEENEEIKIEIIDNSSTNTNKNDSNDNKNNNNKNNNKNNSDSNNNNNNNNEDKIKENKIDEIQQKEQEKEKEIKIEKQKEIIENDKEREEEQEEQEEQEQEEEDDDDFINYNQYKYISQRNKGSNNIGKLLIVIPSVRREANKDHLSEILGSFEDQSKDITPLSGLDIKVLVFNNNPKQHPVFSKLKEYYRYKFRDMFSFMDNPGRLIETEAIPSFDDSYYLNRNETTFKMRQKNLDIVKMLRTVKSEAEYIMIMEDDFPLCSSTISILPYLLKKSLLYNPKWDLIKTSVGLNGFIIRSKYIDKITNYLEHNRKYKPIEHLLSEWMCGMRDIRTSPDIWRNNNNNNDNSNYKNNHINNFKCNENKRNSLIFKLTLFSHIDGGSTYKRDANSIKFPHCWYDYTHLLPVGDRFYVKQCSDDDLAPCIQYTPIKSMITDLSEISHLNHYLKAKVVISPTTKRNITIDVSFVQRYLPVIYRSTSILEDTHNFSTSGVNRHLRDHHNNNNKPHSEDKLRIHGDHYDEEDEENESTGSSIWRIIKNLFFGFLIFILISIILIFALPFFKKFNTNKLMKKTTD